MLLDAIARASTNVLLHTHHNNDHIPWRGENRFSNQRAGIWIWTTKGMSVMFFFSIRDAFRGNCILCRPTLMQGRERSIFLSITIFNDNVHLSSKSKLYHKLRSIEEVLKCLQTFKDRHLSHEVRKKNMSIRRSTFGHLSMLKRPEPRSTIECYPLTVYWLLHHWNFFQGTIFKYFCTSEFQLNSHKYVNVQ